MRKAAKTLVLDIDQCDLEGVNYAQYDHLPWEWYICTREGTHLITTHAGLACMDAVVRRLAETGAMFGKTTDIFIVPVPAPDNSGDDIDISPVKLYMEKWAKYGVSLGAVRKCSAFGEFWSSANDVTYHQDVVTVAIPIVRSMRHPVMVHTILRTLRYCIAEDHSFPGKVIIPHTLKLREVNRRLEELYDPKVDGSLREFMIGPGDLKYLIDVFNQLKRVEKLKAPNIMQRQFMRSTIEHRYIQTLEKVYGSSIIEV